MSEQGDFFSPGVAEAPQLALMRLPADPCAEVHERFMTYGPSALDEGDTLALILSRCSINGAGAVATADALMERFGGLGGSLALLSPNSPR